MLNLEIRLQELEPQYNLELKTNKIYADSTTELSEQKRKSTNHKSRMGVLFTGLIIYFGLKLGYALEKNIEKG